MKELKIFLIAKLIGIVRWVRNHELNFDKDKIEGCVVIGDRAKIHIEESVSFGGNVTLFANAPIEIGKHTMIGLNSVLHTSTHNYNNHPMWIERIDRPIRIGIHVWIGANVIICPGVIVMDFAVIGAGSVVVANVPERAIVAGNPARIIKFREKIHNRDVDVAYPENAFITKMSYLDRDCKRNIN
ncbi:MAG: hypothetical protein DI538_05165 [Azospira oryzae]|jgi:acetyltransferase-like isoleucine patch superfamily enzyme|nr:MAG: hypothetical protein DI538_05165 [Azospira oryzae]